jgi:NAD(P)-dependent dehydrogenase (short-subunit alcohol dehydrogenase family)
VFGTDGPAPTEIEIGADDVVVVTGGARGVTALCVQALAERGAAEFLLLGRSELAEEPPWAIGVDDADLQSATIAALSDGSRPPTPRAVNSLHRRLLAGREIRATLDRCATAGARARYLAVDITDPSAVRDTLAAERHRVTAVVHGAGALADALLPRKSAANVRDVLGPKLTGLASVLDALDGAPLRHIVLFCSVAGVFGNAGQADYAAANEALARWAASLRAADVVQPGVPRRRVTAIAWGAWDGGMVSPELRELFLARGVAPLRPAAATRAFVDQFTAARAEDGYVLLGPPTALKAPPNPATTAPIEALRDITALPAEPAVLAHRIGAHPVLPAAFAIGWMISTVERALPGLRVVECREFQVLNGIVFDGRPAAGHRVSVERGNADDGLLLRVAVRGEPVGRGAGAPPGDVTHYAATLRLTARDAAGPGPTAPGSPGSGGHAPLRSDLPLTDLGQGPENGLEIYTAGVQFHGPALQGMRRVLELGDDRFVVECRLGDLGVADGAYAGAFYSPVLADVVLQAPPVIGHRLLGAACLPLAVGRLELMRPLPDDQPFVVVVDDVRLGRNRVTVTATACDEEGNVMQRYTDVTVVSTPDLADRFAAAVATWQREARP